MRRAMRVAAVLVGFLFIVIWFALGANRGWTQTTRTRMEKDPVTDIEFPKVEKHFSPGVEALGAGLLVAAAIAGISFAFQPKPKH